MSTFQIYVGESGLRAENAKLKAELERMKADRNRLAAIVGEAAVETAVYASAAHANRASSGAMIGQLGAVRANAAQPAASVNVRMGEGAVAGAQVFDGGDGCKVSIGPAKAPIMNAAIAAARAKRTIPARPASVQPVDLPAVPDVSHAEEVDIDEAVQRFSQIELR